MFRRLCIATAILLISIGAAFADTCPTISISPSSQAVCGTGTVWDWGYNYNGQLGNGTAWNDGQYTPLQVPGLTGIVAVAGGEDVTLVLKGDGTVWGWGYNTYGQLGNGTTNVSQATPVQALGLTNVVAIAEGVSHTIALKDDGRVWAWGSNNQGALGNGIGSDQHSPVQVSGLSGIVAVAAGNCYTVALKGDGTVWDWGSGYAGELGNGNNSSQATPVQVLGLTGVVAIAAGDSSTAALKSDGTVWTWGNNSSGELGNGNTTSQNSPVQVSGLNGVIAIAEGEYHAIALRSDGTVWNWGSNFYGELGNGGFTSQSTPVQVTGLSGVIAIAGGDNDTIALGNDGTVWGWGRADLGQLGVSGTNSRTTPVQVPGLTGVSAIGAGRYHTIALRNVSKATFTASVTGTPAPSYQWSKGSVSIVGATSASYSSGLSGSYKCVATNTCGSATSNTAALTISGLSPAFTAQPSYQPFCGGTATITVTATGTPSPTYRWYNSSGSIAGATNASYITNSIGTSYYCIATNSCGSATSNTIVLGAGNAPSFTTQPSNKTICASNTAAFTVTATLAPTYQWFNASGSIPGATGASYTTGSAGSYYCVATNACGSTTSTTAVLTVNTIPTLSVSPSNRTNWASNMVWDWGFSYYGQIGTGFNMFPNYYATPVQVSSPTEVVAVAGGAYHTIALRSDGTIWAWGLNASGELGNGNTANQYTPIQVPCLTGVTAISGGALHTIALKSDGTVWTWGYNHYGQLGNGNTTDQHAPAQVPGLTSVIAVAGGEYHTIALKSDGTVWTWGYNNHGQLGNGNTTDQHAPIQIPGLIGVRAIAGGWLHTIALKNDGTVWDWGDNEAGQLGTGNTTDQSTPVQVSGLTGVTAIAGGGYQSKALKGDGRVWGWGVYSGDGSTTPQNTPVQVPSLIGVTSIAAGTYHSIALKDDGTVWIWGDNSYGQLGNNGTTTQYTPVQVWGLCGVVAIAGGMQHSIAINNTCTGTFTATVTGTPASSYKWYRSGTLVQGVGGASLTATSPGSYYCVATNSCGSATSNTVVLTVGTIPSFTTQPSSRTLSFPSTATLAVGATGTPTPTYQWYKSSVQIPGATNASYTIGVAGSYYCVATNDCGAATSSTATLTVNGMPPIKSIQDDKLLSDGTWVETDASIISAAFSDYFYIEADNRISGIRVKKTAHGLSAGMRADVIGQMATNSDFERYIDALTATQNGTGSVLPLAMNNHVLGGRSADGGQVGGQVGVKGGVGLNNIGLLVSTWGKVTKVGTAYVYLYDGSALNDGTGNGIGVRVVCNTAGHAVGDFMLVTGISSCFKSSSGDIIRQIIVP